MYERKWYLDRHISYDKSCKLDMKSGSHDHSGMELASVQVFLCKHSLTDLSSCCVLEASSSCQGKERRESSITCQEGKTCSSGSCYRRSRCQGNSFLIWYHRVYVPLPNSGRLMSYQHLPTESETYCKWLGPSHPIPHSLPLPQEKRKKKYWLARKTILYHMAHRDYPLSLMTLELFILLALKV